MSFLYSFHACELLGRGGNIKNVAWMDVRSHYASLGVTVTTTDQAYFRIFSNLKPKARGLVREACRDSSDKYWGSNGPCFSRSNLDVSDFLNAEEDFQFG